MEVNMSLVGKAVLNKWGNTIRYGVVKSEETKNKWKYCVIRWVNDEIYVESMKYLTSLRNGQDYTKHTYRVDELLFIDVDKQLTDLREIKKKFTK